MSIQDRRPFTRTLFIAFTLLSGVCLGMLIVAYGSASSLYEFEDSFSLEKFRRSPRAAGLDVVCVLAGARGRISQAAQIWAEVSAREPRTFFYVSGMGPQSNWSVFLKQVDPELRNRMTETQVILEKESANTIENAAQFALEAKKRGWRSVLLVTSRYHMKRAELLFSRALGHEFRLETASLEPDSYTVADWHHSWIGIEVTVIEYFKYILAKGTSPVAPL